MLVSMNGYFWISIILFAEVLIFVSEIVLASVNKKNKILRKNISIEDIGFIDLNKGFRTNISIFRFSLFIVYIILVVLYFDINTVNIVEELMLYFLGGVLIYMVSLMNSKVFVFYSSYFVVSSPFNFFKRDLMIDYDSIIDYKIYKALYNSFYLKLTLKDSKTLFINFSGSYFPKNDLTLRYILDKKTDIRKTP